MYCSEARIDEPDDLSDLTALSIHYIIAGFGFINMPGILLAYCTSSSVVPLL